MRFLLINPQTGSQRMPGYFPLGLGYIAQILLDKGYEVEVLDINAYRWPDEQVTQRVQEAEFDVVGITGTVTEFKAVRWLTQLVKTYHPEATVILGGGLPTAFPQQILKKTQADIAVLGEGEVTIREIADLLNQGRAMANVPGISYRDGEAIRITAPREHVKDLDTIPFPARHLFPLERYIQNPVPYLRMFDPKVRVANIVSSRGCPYRCAYCFHGLWGDHWRGRSAENVVAEMRFLHDTYDINGIFFMDDTFVLNRKRALEICERLIEQDLGIIWVASGRVNLMDSDLLNKMKAAGCRVVLYGIESGSQKILDEMRKGVKVAQAREAILQTWEAGILPIGYLMIGMFSESRETVEETIRFCNETGLISGFSYATPFPGTELYAKAVEMGKIGPEDAEHLLERWGDWGNAPLVNLSSLSNEALDALRKEAQRRIFLGNWAWKMKLYIKVLGGYNAAREAIRYVKKSLRIGRYT